MDLPSFRYHPDPVATGSVVPSDATCECCGRARGFVYNGPTYGPRTVKALCPWCVADGEAHRQLELTFADAHPLAGVSAAVREEVVRRTPGYSGWQQERWLTHCGDACAFLGPTGREDVEAFGEELVASLREDAGWLREEAFAAFYAGLDRDGEPVAFAFRCLHCGALVGYIDYT